MVDKNIIYRYLESLEDSIRKIRNMHLTIEKIVSDDDVKDLLDRRMQKAIEACIDIAAHIVAAEKLGYAETSAALFILLVKNKVISEGLAKRLVKAIGLRNIIVHEYTRLDYKLAYSNLEEKLDDLEEFAKRIKQYLEVEPRG